MMRRQIAPGQIPLPLIWHVNLSPFEQGPLVRTLRDLNRWKRGPVVSTTLAECLGISQRTARYYLTRMEQAGMVKRPAGPRSGWVAL